MTATVHDGGLTRVYSAQWRPYSSNRYAKWLAAVNPFSLPHKNEIITSHDDDSNTKNPSQHECNY
jgi:hypothetical protein